MRQIGSGGMASVYEADDTALDRRVAVKILNPHYAADEAFVVRFQAEARSIARLKHPCIVDVYDVGQDGARHYIVMELVEGCTLRQLLNQGPLSLDQTINIGIQIAQALDHAHEAGIVHRDVKAQNVLVTESGSAKLVDFGIAAVLSDLAPDDSGPVLGTVHYLAPERARGEPSTPATDIYSFGVLLYEMATGSLPFRGETAGDVALQQVRDAPFPPSRLNPAVPAFLEQAILRALAKDPRNRPSSGSELAVLLLQFDRIHDETTRILALTTTQKTPTMALPRRPGRASGGSNWPIVLLALVTAGLLLGLIPLWASVLSSAQP